MPKPGGRDARSEYTFAFLSLLIPVFLIMGALVIFSADARDNWPGVFGFGAMIVAFGMAVSALVIWLRHRNSG